MMRGTQWKAFIEKSCEEMEQFPKDPTLLQQLGADRGVGLAKRVHECFPHYAESHPVTSERFLKLFNQWSFRSHIEFLSPEQVEQLVEEFGLRL